MKRLLPVLICLTLLAGCGGTSKDEPPKAKPTPTAATPDPLPVVGACHSFTFEQATAPVDETAPVDCAQPHQAVTFAVGQVDQVVNGHLLSIDSDQVHAQLDRTCTAALPKFIGGSVDAQRLSQFKAIWFAPSLKQADLGASWYRCDLVALQQDGQLMQLPAKAKGLLNRPAGARFATCAAGQPGAQGFTKVACGADHQWRAAKVIALPPKTKYNDPAQTKAGDQACKDLASGAAGNSLKFSWSFAWPTQEQWAAGQRWGICWLPK